MNKINNNQPKKILISSLAYFPLIGGAEVAIKEITDRISPADIVFDLVTLRFDKKLPKQEKVGNVTVHRLGFCKDNPTASDLVRFPLYLNKILFPILALWHMRYLDKKNKYDGFWSMMSYAGFPIVLFRMFVRKVPYLLSLQEGDDLTKVNNRWRVRAVNFLFKRIFTEAKIVQPISNYLADFAKQMKVLPGNIKMVPNGISRNIFLRKFSTDEAKLKLNITTDSTLIVSVSRLVPKNAVDVLIKALALLPKNYHLAIAGDGPEKDNLMALVRRERVLDRVYFIGNLLNSDIVDFISAGDVFARVSRFEGQGIAFLEAMALGVPVVASGVGGITDFVKDTKTGLIAKTNDVRDVAEKIKRIIDDEKLRLEIIDRAKQMVYEKYDWDLLYKDIENILKDL